MFPCHCKLTTLYQLLVNLEFNANGDLEEMLKDMFVSRYEGQN